MNLVTKMIAVAALAASLTACGGGTASVKADAARVNVMGHSLNTMSKEISKGKEVTKCKVTHEKDGWLAGMWTSTESFETTCENDPYSYNYQPEYEPNALP